jgi:hypothetical protein
MTYLFDDDEIKSVASLLSRLKRDERRLPRSNRSIPKIWFRGLKDIGYPLIPTFYRGNYKIKDEIYMMNLFKQDSRELINQIPDSDWEWMFLMRHHNLPSRLLDWSENPFIGLYFSVCPRNSGQQSTTDGVLWCLLPVRLNQWALGWPTDNNSLPMFTLDEGEYSCPENDAIKNYLPSRIQNIDTTKTPKPPAAGMCPRTNQRMRAQFSVFTVHHADNAPLEKAGDRTHIWRYRIPASKKPTILDDLRRIGIARRTVFPELDNVSLEVRESFEGY